MEPIALRCFYEYNEWANARLFDVLASLPAETLKRPIVSSFPSLLETASHIVLAEWIWLERWQGESPRELPAWVEGASIFDLRERLRAVERTRAALLAELSSTRFSETLHYETFDGTPRATRMLDLFLHVVNHSSYHRGQLVTMLRQVGAEPPATDYVLFDWDCGERE